MTLKDQREIKFRAWSIGYREMIYYDRCWATEFSLCLNKVGMDSEYVDVTRTMDEIGVEIMQYTGFKDKNGKEIYEGDIVKGFFETRVVIWDENGWFQIPIDEYKSDSRESIDTYPECQSRLSGYLGHLVLGNVYENEELL